MQVAKAEHDVVGPSGPVGRADLGDDAAITEEAHDEAAVVGQGEDLDSLAGLGAPYGACSSVAGAAWAGSPAMAIASVAEIARAHAIFASRLA